MKRKASLLALALLVTLPVAAQDAGEPPALAGGRWRAWLSFQTHDVPFELDIAPLGSAGVPVVSVRNGPERIPIHRVEWRGQDLVLGLDHYQGEVVARVSADGKRMDGVYRRGTRGGGQEFHAAHGLPRFAPLPADTAPTGTTSTSDPAALVGRWAMTEEGDREKDWIATFEVLEDGSILGNTARLTGDLRWLVGTFERGRLRLSTWDGAHTLLYEARLQPDGTLSGERYWGGGRTTWTARRDPGASLPDPWTMVTWKQNVEPRYLRYKDVLRQGPPREVQLKELFGGRPAVLYVIGTWCPNCTDQTQMMVELHEKYARQGLTIVGLSFERSRDPTRARTLITEYVRRHGVKYPILFGGQAHEGCMTGIERLISYPTTVFVDAEGKVRATFTGFRGPASQDHAAMRLRFEALIEDMLEETPRAGE